MGQPRKFSPDSVLVAEIFDSLQGEGRNLGAPSTFLRLSHCNLACSWCDTPYTWDWSRFDQASEIKQWDVDALADDLNERGPASLVITGGEPLLQAQALENLIPRLAGHFVEVETAGTIIPSHALIELVDQWNVSPKLASSQNPLKRRRKTEALEAFAKLRGAEFKFVIGDDKDLAEADELAESLGLSPESVWLMPEGTDATSINEGAKRLVPECLRRGWHLSYRLHVALYGDQRGV